MTNKIPIVDEWKPNVEDIIFRNSKDIITAPISAMYKIESQENETKQLDVFWIRPKKSYNSDLLRDHTCQYINYFEKYYDFEKEYFTNIAYIKFMIDGFPDYNIQNFFFDMNKYIIQPSISAKIKTMVDHNYSLSLSYKNVNTPQLQYTNDHAKALMEISIMMNFCIPLITHFAYTRNISDIDEFLLDVYDNILYAPQFAGSVDIIAKLFETTVSNVSKNAKNNAVIWNKQDIRGKDVVTHSLGAERNIILNIIPKYTFAQNMVSLNYTSIQKSNKYQITDIQYEYSYVPLSSSKRDGEDASSDFDKFESNLVHRSESMYLQAKFNYEYCMEKIRKQWGPFNRDEIEFYKRNLKNENGDIVNNFQRQLIFNLFYKYFGDTVSINAINQDNYIEMMMAARKMLQNYNLGFLPYVLSGKVNKIVSRKVLNKKESAEMEASQYYQTVKDKYKNDKILQQILGTIATIITSSFNVIDYQNQENNGKTLFIDSKIIIEETLLYTLLI